MAGHCFNFLSKASWPGVEEASLRADIQNSRQAPASQTSVVCLLPGWPTIYLLFFSLHWCIYFYSGNCAFKRHAVLRARRTPSFRPRRDLMKIEFGKGPAECHNKGIQLALECIRMAPHLYEPSPTCPKESLPTVGHNSKSWTREPQCPHA